MKDIKAQMKDMIIFVISVCILVFLDQFTKVQAVQLLKGKKAFEIIP